MPFFQQYLDYVICWLPATLPWIIILFFINLRACKKATLALLPVSIPQANGLSLRSTTLALVCMPVALFVSLWTFVQVLVYALLASGLQCLFLRITEPEIDSKVAWKWAYASNPVGWSFLVALGAMCFAGFLPNLLPLLKNLHL